MTAILGYARVSTTGQDLDAQLAALALAGVEGRVFTDKLSGSAKTARPGLAAMLNYARAGDTVVVTAIDRLGRSVAEVTKTIADLAERRILLHALREGVDTATPAGRAVAAIMATLAELELELGRERRAASRESRRARHLPPTRPPKLNLERQEQLRRLAATGEPVRELAAAFGIGGATAYRYLSQPPHAASPSKLLCRQICQEGKGKRRPGPSSWTPLRLPFDLHAVTSVSVSTRCQSDIRGLVTSRADCFGWSGSQV